MDFEIDQDIINDFIEQVNKEQLRLVEIIAILKKDSSVSNLFEESGQISDRIFGAVSMLQVDQFAGYSRKVKEIGYKCAQTSADQLKVRDQCIKIIEQYSIELGFIKEDGHDFSYIVARDIEYKKHIVKIDRILASELHSIAAGSVAFEDDQKFILVYDKSRLLEFAVQDSTAVYIPEPKFFTTLHGFKKSFYKYQSSLYGVVVNIGNDEWMQVIKEVRSFDPRVPIIIVSKRKKGLEQIDKKALQVQGLLASTGNFKKIIDFFKKVYKTQDLISRKLEVEKADIGSEECTQDEKSYVEVSALIFKSGAPSCFDIFLKVSQKFIKVINKDQIFDIEQIKRHISKGIKKYYILRDEQNEFVRQFDKEMQRIYDDPEIGLCEKKNNFLDYAQDVQCFFNEHQVDLDAIEQVRDFVQTSEKLVKDIEADSTVLKEFFSDLAMMERATSICLMAGLFLQQIHAKQDTFTDIALVCYLHDIGLKDEDDVIKNGNQNLMNEEQKQIFWAHPKKGARMLIELGIKPTLAEAVSHHHMRFDGSGFPVRDPNIALNPIAEVIGMAEEFLATISECEKSETVQNPVEQFMNKMNKRFSPRLQHAFSFAFK